MSPMVYVYLSVILFAIGTATGVAPTINASTGAITLHTGTAQDLDIDATSAPAFAALGFPLTFTQPRNGGGTAGTGTVVGNDIATFTKESISGGAVTAYNAAGTPVNLQLRWAKTDSAALGTGHSDSWNLFYQTDPSATGTTVAEVALCYTGDLSNPAERLYTHRNTVIRRLARADELLPRPLADNLVDIAAALELLRWR